MSPKFIYGTALRFVQESTVDAELSWRVVMADIWTGYTSLHGEFIRVLTPIPIPVLGGASIGRV